MNRKKVLIGMSGGVDSTVSTLLLKEQGYEVEGVYMKLHSKPGYHEIHQARAQKAADFAGVKLHILDLQDKFNEKVFRPFIETYQEGKTPNPCALCNRNIKFGAMVAFADEIGADYVATGHYIRHDGQYLLQAHDDTKDQSYFLFYIDPVLVPRLLFPLGERHKSDIKAFAASIPGLESFASQGESSEICFVETTYMDVLKPYVPVDQEGDVLDLSGKVVGKHKGYMHYTIGKRKGFNVHGAHDPHFVVAIKPETNQIVVGPREALECRSVELENVNMFDSRKEFDCEVKLRYRTTAVPCHVVIDGNHAKVNLNEPVFGVASGQAGVFYDGEKLLGGGWII
ncbi:MAG: thiouridylase [Sulfuricurvum sp. MLSB]|uniref:tRNA 2-thiouridine(34) synthase MnmA n=1 Tax=unclassified Sulfuricurvum TaxID=2632390 RepID=UPI000507EB9F|nr:MULTISPECIES: tRNA 2-thiouridine(34) synthase MnmA [unclassified Sulfuricurvum]KFN39596.1 MAG: thiouridylase [Sulfuricurvum sp. MLSB]